MTETLFHAYTPLILWTSLGLFICRFLPQWLPRFLGRGLYWIGVPLELFALARQSQLGNFNNEIGLPLIVPIITVGTLLLGLMVVFLILWKFKEYYHACASFILASVLGNTGFVGLAIAPFLINSDALGWAVLYSITHNVIGPYGLGVVVASYFSQSKATNSWWMQLREVLTVPCLWAFLVGILTQKVQFPQIIESGLQESISIVIACAFLLTGIRLAQLHGWKSLKLAFLPAAIKVCVIPLLVGIVTTCLLGLSGDRRLAMVLMSGMPSAFAGLILAEEYNLDRDLIASSIIISTLLLLIMLPLWMLVFR
ncbi:MULTISPECIES: AEC family transporter [Fischerella]|uniref:Transporter n=1 Tax=Fischerella muscicola CCMEE 5323 TaxID=2019572 RepID=A0A2N6JXR8_FISMU|nr:MULTISPECIES: AEC family transporter [Fischerella]MBD2431075.1 AEC family transporter [Fischerella sp. FACHB-380]PLZ85318.1 transporter [Fischerella muscicola CCMEE 5323]